MRFVIRADAFKRTGSGHVTRCIAVAEELLSQGFFVAFLGNTLELPWVTDLVKSTGFSQVLTEESEFEPNQLTDILILDSYEIPMNSDFLIRRKWRRFVLLADSHTPDYRADVCIQTSLNPFKGVQNEETLMVGGPQYFPIRKGIQLEESFGVLNRAHRLLLTTGGNEITGLVDKFIVALSSLSFEFSAEVLSNRSFREMDSRFKISSIGNNFVEKLAQTDLVITSSGVSSIEIAANKIPMAIFCAVDNQRENYALLTTRGYATGIGQFDKNQGRVDIEALSKILDSPPSVNRPVRTVDQNLDFNGSKRIVELILSLN
jgi:spore coat polysaccharide biosynthesis predicted glycosyltransferase SpsG